MDYKTLLKILKKNGWIIETGGRHLKVKKGQQRIPIPTHSKKDIRPKTLKSIENSTGVKLNRRK